MNLLNYIELKKISNDYTPQNLVNKLGFEEVLSIVRYMLSDKEWDEFLHKYATNVLEEIRKKYPEKWNSNWKYDAFLGYSYDIIFKYDERYIFYKRAFDKVHPQPPQLLVALAECCWCPRKPPISEQEAILLVKQAIASVKYIEAVGLLRGLYKSTGNSKEQLYWEKVLESIRDTGIHLPSLDQIFDM